MNTVQKHIIRYPKARATTLSYLILRDERTDQLIKELELERLANEVVSAARHVPWWRRLVELWRQS